MLGRIKDLFLFKKNQQVFLRKMSVAKGLAEVLVGYFTSKVFIDFKT